MSALPKTLQGVSFVARAVYAMSLAMSFESGSENPPIADIAAALGLSDAAMVAAIEELYPLGLAWPCTDLDNYDGPKGLETSRTTDFLCWSAAPVGRPRPADWTALRARTFAVVGDRCIYCGEPATDVDHIVSLRRGGTNHQANLAPACGPCNSSKGSRTYQEFVASRGGLRR